MHTPPFSRSSMAEGPLFPAPGAPSLRSQRRKKKAGKGFFSLLALCMTFFFPLCSFADETSALPAPQDPEFVPVLEKLLSQGVDAAQIQQVFSHPGFRFNPAIPSLFFLVQESKLDYAQFSTEASISRAKTYMQTHEKTLDKAFRQFGVPPEIVTAILLVETRLGTFMGRHPAAANLASIAAMDSAEVRDLIWERVKDKTRFDRETFNKRAESRAVWAQKELAPLLAYAAAKGVNAAEIPGSYAGAVGICQFMPSNIQAHGADGDGDGKVRLSTHEDAIFSAARYLKNHGWKRGMSPEAQLKVILTYNKSRPYAEAVLDVAGKLRKKNP
ncbi:lytic murein transglycosylase [Desulfobotulus sp.]|uniref:lytic murein transglycosylase n=1 Tax=Desulfobotulus sp. TaxID=1940337 RepID=UPI002A35AA0F|nr:lytic murein transglycosylase [Desulfobotulus sp.]MDY0163280.1 lytic murein transglycosylase [Desulfobotulus sp.]